MECSFISHSLQDTDAIAARLAAQLRGGEVLLLHGQLGAGKTALVKGLARALGVTDIVTSPTFTLMNRYQGKQLTLYHFDLYRLDEEAAEDMGFEEFYNDPNAVCCIEWSKPHDYDGKVIDVYASYVEGQPNARMYRWQL